jgi:hypothetical protein
MTRATFGSFMGTREGTMNVGGTDERLCMWN